MSGRSYSCPGREFPSVKQLGDMMAFHAAASGRDAIRPMREVQGQLDLLVISTG